MQGDEHTRDAAYFQSLPYEDQLTLVWKQGKLLEARRIPDFWLHLYAVNAFFVEMWVCQRLYDVTLVRLLSDIHELDPYIDKVSLGRLFADDCHDAF